jgi:hypothetical protein
MMQGPSVALMKGPENSVDEESSGCRVRAKQAAAEKAKKEAAVKAKKEAAEKAKKEEAEEQAKKEKAAPKYRAGTKGPENYMRRLVMRLFPNKQNKWDKWARDLAEEDIESEADLMELEDEVFLRMRISSLLKNRLLKHRKTTVMQRVKTTRKLKKMPSDFTAANFSLQSKKNAERSCKISVRILSLSDIDTSINSFKIELILFLLWRDPTLKPEDIIDWKKEWHPRVTVTNIRQVDDDFFTRETSDPKLIKLPQWPTHQVLHARKFTFQLAQLFELTKFPFDVQLLQIIFRPAEHNKLVQLRQMDEKVCRGLLAPRYYRLATGYR